MALITLDEEKRYQEWLEAGMHDQWPAEADHGNGEQIVYDSDQCPEIGRTGKLPECDTIADQLAELQARIDELEAEKLAERYAKATARQNGEMW